MHKCFYKLWSLKFENDEDRFIAALETVIENSASVFDSKYKLKSSHHSTKLRDDGNKSFKDGQFDKAVQEYTESIVYAVDLSEELALAYGNRSAALFELEKFTECIEDINRALDQNYPDKLRTKLHKRKGVCLSTLGRPGANSSFQEALVWLGKMNLSKDKMNESEVELKTLISAPCSVNKLPANVMQYLFPKLSIRNQTIPSASDAVTIEYSQKFGRHVVATRKIKPGEILIIEKTYCSKLIHTNIYTHCSYCLKLSWHLIPCKWCVNVAYCSEFCKDKAWDGFHEVECPVIRHMPAFGFNDWNWIGLRMAIMASQKGTKLDALKQELKDIDRNTDPLTKGFTNDGKFTSNQYRSVYSLSHNGDECAKKERVRTALTAAVTICTLATESEMFGKKLSLDTLTTNPDVLFLGKLILKNFHICNTNIHNLGVSQSSTGEYAFGLLPCSSLLNHSCDPNTFRQWHTDHLALYAAFPIEQGEQIFDNYGPLFTDGVKSQRHHTLMKWYFNCECLACEEDWPLLLDVPSYKKQPITRDNKKKLAKIFTKLGKIHKGLTQKNNKEKEMMMIMINELWKTIERLFSLAQRPCQELYMVFGIMQQFYLSGDTIFDYVPGSPGYDEESGPPSFYSRLDGLLL